MSYVKVTTLDALEEEVPLRAEVEGTPVVLVRHGDQVYALSDRCTHEEASLSQGFVDEGTIECPRHGAQFELATGKALTLPATWALQTYAVRLDGADVLVAVDREAS